MLLNKIRCFLEPGPVVLVSSSDSGKRNIKTMAWQTMIEFSPALLGCVISSVNFSFDMIRKSKECVINTRAIDLAKKVVGIGNSSGPEINQFEAFNLTPVAGTKVNAPLIKECYANFEYKLVVAQLINKYSSHLRSSASRRTYIA